MKSGKRHMTDGMELPNQEKIRTLGEKEAYEYLKIKLRKSILGELENYAIQNYVAVTLSKG